MRSDNPLSLEGEGWGQGVSALIHIPSPRLSPSRGREILGFGTASPGGFKLVPKERVALSYNYSSIGAKPRRIVFSATLRGTMNWSR